MRVVTKLKTQAHSYIPHTLSPDHPTQDSYG